MKPTCGPGRDRRRGRDRRVADPWSPWRSSSRSWRPSWSSPIASMAAVVVTVVPPAVVVRVVAAVMVVAVPALLVVGRGSRGYRTRRLHHVVELESKPQRIRRRGAAGPEQDRPHHAAFPHRRGLLGIDLRLHPSVKVFPGCAAMDESVAVHLQNHHIVVRTVVEVVLEPDAVLRSSIEPGGHRGEDEPVLGLGPDWPAGSCCHRAGGPDSRRRSPAGRPRRPPFRPSSCGRRHPCPRSRRPPCRPARRPGACDPNSNSNTKNGCRTPLGWSTKAVLSPASFATGAENVWSWKQLDVTALEILRLCLPNDLKGVRLGATMWS